jgi:hypothetical protein
MAVTFDIGHPDIGPWADMFNDYFHSHPDAAFLEQHIPNKRVVFYNNHKGSKKYFPRGQVKPLDHLPMFYVDNLHLKDVTPYSYLGDLEDIRRHAVRSFLSRPVMNYGVRGLLDSFQRAYHPRFLGLPLLPERRRNDPSILNEFLDHYFHRAFPDSIETHLKTPFPDWMRAKLEHNRGGWSGYRADNPEVNERFLQLIENEYNKKPSPPQADRLSLGNKQFIKRVKT